MGASPSLPVDRTALFVSNKLLRLGTTYGGWIIPVDAGLTADSVCYCAGAGEDISFDCALVEWFHCQVRVIANDCFHPMPVVMLYTPLTPSNTSAGKVHNSYWPHVTNLTLPSRAVVRFYNKRGMAEQWIKEGKQAVKMTRLSCHRFRANEVWLSLIAYNLGNLWRRLVLPARIGNWPLTSLQQRLVKTGGRLIKPARYYWLLLAESHLTRRLFADMLRRIVALPLPAR